MATKTFYLASTLVDGWCRLSETAQAAATTGSGWTVGTSASSQFTFKAAAETSTVQSGAPDGSLDLTNFDALRSELFYKGTFASANWTFTFDVLAVSNGGAQDGRVRFRLFRGANADGSGATEITSAIQSCSIATNIATSGGPFLSSLTVNPGSITLNNEYLFVQMGWEATGAGGMSTADALLRTGSSGPAGTRIVTSDFTPDIDPGDVIGWFGANAASITNPFPVTGSVAVAEADLVAVLINEQVDITTTGVTDNLGNTYVAQNAGGDPSNQTTGILYYSRVTNAGTLTTINVACVASGNNVAVQAAVFQGPFKTSPLDANPACVISDITSPFVGPATGTLAQADEMVLAWTGHTASGSALWTPDSGFTKIAEELNGTVLAAGLAYKIVSSTTGEQVTWTASVNPSSAVIGIASFKLGTDETTGTLSATDSGTDTASITGTVAITGTLAATDSGTDTAAITGDVELPTITGTLSATDSGTDTATITGDPVVTGTLSATDSGTDTASITGGPVAGGTLAATDSGTDTAAVTGNVVVSGTLNATDSGTDTASFAGTVAVTGTLAATDSGTDTAAITGTVVITGTFDATDSGTDTAAFTGTVTDPGIEGTLAATDSGTDTASITGGPVVSGALAATDSGADTASITGNVVVSGTLSATDSGTDTAAITGAVVITGTLAATDSGTDTAAITGNVEVEGASGALSATDSGPDTASITGGPVVAGTLSATEVGQDTATFGGNVLVSGGLAAIETGTDTASITGTVLEDITGTLAASESGSDIFVAYDILTPAARSRPGKRKLLRVKSLKQLLDEEAPAAPKPVQDPVAESLSPELPVVEQPALKSRPQSEPVLDLHNLPTQHLQEQPEPEAEAAEQQQPKPQERVEETPPEPIRDEDILKALPHDKPILIQTKVDVEQTIAQLAKDTTNQVVNDDDEVIAALIASGALAMFLRPEYKSKK